MVEVLRVEVKIMRSKQIFLEVVLDQLCIQLD